MNYSETELLYSPSKWSHRNNALQYHIDFCFKVSNQISEKIPCTRNVKYGERERQKFDIYGTDLPRESSIFIFIHGGYWQELSKDLSSYVVEPFYKNRIKTIIIGYSLCPEVTVRDIVNEIQNAMKNIIEYAKQNGCKKIFISGYSCGSHLISSLFTEFYASLSEEEKQLFKGVILCCGIYDLTPLIDTYINDPLKLTYDEAKALSPLCQNLPHLDFTINIVVGEYDSPTFIKQSQLYFQKVKNNATALFKIIKNVDHFSIVENYNYDEYELVQFIIELEKKY